MTVKRRKKSNGRIYLEEYKSVRVDGEVKSIYVRSLGPENPVEPKKPKRRVIDRLEPGPSHRAGDVTLLWKLAQDLDFVKIIDSICCQENNIEGISPGKLITAWAINRVIDPTSATQLERWIPTTDLPRLMDVNPIDLDKHAFLSALDFICYEDKWTDGIQDNTRKIDDALYRRWRELYPLKEGEDEVLAYDITTVLFFGVSCPLAELGYNPDKIKRLLVNLALVVSKRERYPILHIIHNGSKNGKATIKNLILALQESSIETGTLIWDRGNVSKDNIIDAEKAHWKIICGIPKTSKQVNDILKNTTVDCSWNTLVRSSKAGHVYAFKTDNVLYGQLRNLIVYMNRERGVKDANSRNEALLSINEALSDLNKNGSDWNEKRLHAEIKKIVGEYGRFIETKVKRNGTGPRVSWKFNDRRIREAEKMDGTYLLLSTDMKLSAREVVNQYLEKDFIEKVFRTMKTKEELEPVRHRLETRVRGYLFVCVLAYRLISYLKHKMREKSDKNDTWERADSLLADLERVERVRIKLGRQVKIWYLNIPKKTEKTLKELGFADLFKETTETDFSDVGGKD